MYLLLTITGNGILRSWVKLPNRYSFFLMFAILRHSKEARPYAWKRSSSISVKYEASEILNLISLGIIIGL